ncbi:phosphopantetheine-binding protein [Streptomyces caatingaensis]|uniref:Carrier domain-containing protein n=1 Tax=Streptomyces caatingaensis TaxID=1678637 RepID=A0A0K9XFJ0_9ACTN|nr:phosphopantetheine-binding protein [Streptomyces caatingaensis]KNB52169.1 hypothetical protein AC230_11445 [Streptomyces caatingaensis]
MSTTPADTPVPTVEDVREAVAAALRLPAEEIADDTDLAGLGLTSLQIMRLSGRWRRAGLPVDFATLATEPTVLAWARHLAAAPAA